MIPVEGPPLRQTLEELPALVDVLIANLNLGRSSELSLTAHADLIPAGGLAGSTRPFKMGAAAKPGTLQG